MSLALINSYFGIGISIGFSYKSLFYFEIPLYRYLNRIEYHKYKEIGINIIIIYLKIIIQKRKYSLF